MAGVGEGPLGTTLHSSATKVSYPRPTRVKNKAPAPTQITAEQILREARERLARVLSRPRTRNSCSRARSSARTHCSSACALPHALQPSHRAWRRRG